MRWFPVLALLLVLTGSSGAAGPDDQYLDIYNEILQADGLQQSGHPAAAAARYLEAQAALKRLKDEHPTWNSTIVSFRLDYLAEQIQALARVAPAPSAPPPQVPAPVQVPVPAPTVTEVAGLQEQIRLLTAVNVQLENKLKEALSVQPAAVSPREIAKAEEKVVMLQKEKDLLAVALEQSKAAKTPVAPSAKPDNTASQLADANQALAELKARSSTEVKAVQTELAQLKDSLAEAQKKIAADATEIDALKSAHPPRDSSEITAERDKLKAELAARTKDLADAEAHRDPSVADLRAQLAEVERQRNEYKAKLAASPVAAPAATDAQAEQLRARLAVLEAQAIPYTPQELAMLKHSSSTASAATPAPPSAPAQTTAPNPAQAPATPVESKHIVHSMKDLPPGAGALMTEANRAAMQRDYAKAAQIYQEILRQDPNNVFVLAYLANAQYALGQWADCEKTVTHSLALDPDDPASLYSLGILRYREEKLDEALDALSRSAKYSPTNPATQFYLGNVLAAKGLRPASETAFRKALKFEPDYADAHYGLAWVYASEKPPSLELARWHYRRALDLGHEKNADLEKLLPTSP
jgi:tetratricopeptide (TPR) repeat protein